MKKNIKLKNIKKENILEILIMIAKMKKINQIILIKEMIEKKKKENIHK